MKKVMCFVMCAVSLSVEAVSAHSQVVRGAGSTFAAAAYTSWAFSYGKEKNVVINYQATGSGDGVKQIIARAVDFGATDNPMSPAELQKHGLMQFPTLVSGVVPVVNIPGVKPGQLKLTPSTLAGIFSARITKWNDSEIQAINPGLALPNFPITRVVRDEPSGTTAVFTEYLSKVSNDWASRIGSSLSVNWPKNAQYARGNEGVAAAVQAQQGAIGYVTTNQVFRSNLTYTLLQNRSKLFVAPTDEALHAAVKSTATPRDDEKLSFVDAPSPSAWPITDATYILLERNPRNPEQATRVLRFFYWAFLRGDAMASETGYIPLPVNVQARAVGAFRQVRDTSDAPLNFMGVDTRETSAKMAHLSTRRSGKAEANHSPG